MGLRTLILSNSPLTSTGYGIQTKRFAHRIKDLGHEVLIANFYGNDGHTFNYDGIPILPKLYHPYGSDAAREHYKNTKADILLTLLDAWVLQPQDLQGVRFVPWIPIDSEPLSPPNRRVITGAFERIAMSKFGKRVMEEAGLDSTYIPHGVPTDIYKPIPKDEARAALGLPQDAFVVGMVAANKGAPSRKCFTQQIQAFKLLRDKHPDAVMYIHTAAASPQGENLPEYLAYLGLKPGEVGFCDQYQNLLGYPDHMMAATFSAFDVLTHVSAGEGFGLAGLEAQACGTPVITGDWTAMSELCWSGWKVAKEDAIRWWTPHATHMYWPRPEAIYEQMEAAYQALSVAKAVEKLSNKAVRGASKYDCDHVTEVYWKPLLKRLEERIHGDGPSPFMANLAAMQESNT